MSTEKAKEIDLMRGYYRSPEMTEKLIEVLAAALRADPTQRLGQLVENVCRFAENPIPQFQIWDEEIMELLKPKGAK